MRPRSQRGQGWRKGGDHNSKTAFLQSKKGKIRGTPSSPAGHFGAFSTSGSTTTATRTASIR
jgi:hypothetical protein